MYEIFEQLLQKKGISAYKVAKEAGVTQTAQRRCNTPLCSSGLESLQIDCPQPLS